MRRGVEYGRQKLQTVQLFEAQWTYMAHRTLTAEGLLEEEPPLLEEEPCPGRGAPSKEEASS